MGNFVFSEQFMSMGNEFFIRLVRKIEISAPKELSRSPTGKQQKQLVLLRKAVHPLNPAYFADFRLSTSHNRLTCGHSPPDEIFRRIANVCELHHAPSVQGITGEKPSTVAYQAPCVRKTPKTSVIQAAAGPLQIMISSEFKRN